MIQSAPGDDARLVGSILTDFVQGILASVPNLLAGLLFVLVSAVLIKIATLSLRRLLNRFYPKEEELIVDLAVTVATLFLWFGVLLALLKIVGMGDVAASLGTATGFVGLGVAFALKEMIADTVAGVYLLTDRDFEVGDVVTTASVTGTVVGIDLRKTRIRTEEEDLVVVANREVEKRWTKEADVEEV